MENSINKLGDYKEIVLSLSEIIEEENKYLAEFNLKAAGTLLSKKTKAVNLYRSAVAYLIKNPQDFQGISEEEKVYIKEISTKLDKLLKENDVILKTRMETSKNVMDNIIGMLKTTNATNSTSYGATGSFAPLDRSKNAIAINQTL